MSIAEAVRSGISAKRCLEIWGDVIMRHKQALPPEFGWPSMSIEKRLMAYGHGAKESTALTVDSRGDPVLTRPEAAVDGLLSDRAIAEWVGAILRDAKPAHYVYARLRWVQGKCWADIAEQMNGIEKPISVRDVECMHEAVTMRIKRALLPFRLAKAAA